MLGRKATTSSCPTAPVFPRACRKHRHVRPQRRRAARSSRRRTPETSGNMSSRMHGPHRRPSVALQTCAFFSSPAGRQSPVCARPPFPDDARGMSPSDTAKRPPESRPSPETPRLRLWSAHASPARTFPRDSSGKIRARYLPASRPTRAAPRRSPAFQIFTLRQSLPPPSPMDKAKESAAVGDSRRRPPSLPRLPPCSPLPQAARLPSAHVPPSR